MKRFMVYASQVVVYKTDIEAETKEEAMTKAFVEDTPWKECDSRDWQIDSAEELIE